MLAASLIFIVFAVADIQNLRFDPDPRKYFSQDNPHFQLNEELEANYGRVHQVTFVLEFPDTIYSKEHLTLLKELTDNAWQLPHTKRVESLANYAYSWSEQDQLFVEELVENPSLLDDTAVKRIEQIATEDDAIAKRLVSLSAPMAMVRINAAFYGDDRSKQEFALADAAREVVKDIEARHPDINVLLSGNVISNVLTNEKAIEDTSVLIPLMYAIIFGLLWYLLRSGFAMLGIAIITITSCASAIGIAAHFGFVINLLSITSINIIITVAIAHCVHIYVYFLQAYRSGEPKLRAVTESFRINLQPIFLTSLTTALGFLSMNFSDMPPARDLGNITAIGVSIAFFLSLTLLPGIIMLSPISSKMPKSSNSSSRSMDKFANFVVKNRHSVGIAALIISGIFLSLAPLNVVNDKFTENLKKPHPFRLDNEKIDANFGGLYTIEFDFKAKEGSSISDPEYLNALDKFVDWLREQDDVKNVHSYSDVIKRLNKNMHGDDQSYYRIPQSQDEAAQYLLLYELSQPYGADLNNLIQPDKTASRTIVNIPSFDAIQVFALREKIRAWVELNMPEYMYYPGEGLAVMWTYLGRDAFVSSIQGALIALFVISIIMMVVFKSVRYGLISLIPNMLPAGVGYGVWYLISGNLDMSQMMVLSITIGIVVDDTVHFLSKYIRARREYQQNPENSVRYAFKHVGAPLWITTLVLVAGFALLITSSFQPNSNLGILTAIILVSALALDFLLLPPLLMWLDKRKDDK